MTDVVYGRRAVREALRGRREVLEVWATERAIQILGGNGYTRDFPVERWHRDAKIFTLFGRAVTGLDIR